MSRAALVVCVALALAGATARSQTMPKSRWGTFRSNGVVDANPKLEWLKDGRWMELLEPYSFTDRDGRIWNAPAKAKTDGATIPTFLWGKLGLGGPFEGLYRNASVVHDEACRQTTVKPGEAHRMFYQACRAFGQEERLSKKLFAALWFGTGVLQTCKPTSPTRIPVVHRVTTTLGSELTTQEFKLAAKEAAPYQEQAWNELFALIDNNNPDLHDIEHYELVLETSIGPN